jgi:hypothetical protein
VVRRGLLWSTAKVGEGLGGGLMEGHGRSVLGRR